MAVTVARMVAKLEAETTQFHARMTAAEAQLTKWTSSTTAGRRGTIMLQQGLQQLAFQATGVAGPVGKLSAGLLTIGAGGGAALVAAAGIGAVVGVVNLLTTAARESVKAQDEMIASLNKLGVTGQITAARLKITQLETLRDTPGLWERLKAIPGAFLGDITGGMAGTTFEERREKINREIARLQGVIGQAGGPAERKAEDVAEGRRARRLADIIARQDRVLLERGGVFQALRPGFQAPGFGVTTGGALGLPTPSGPTFANIRRNVPRFVAPDTQPKAGFKMTPEFAIMSSMALLQGAQGGAAGLFGAAAGPLAMINPLAGAITAGFGGIFSLFDKAEERRHRQLIDTVKKLGQEVGLDRVTVVFTGPDGHQVRKTLAELDESDAVERVPGPVGAQG